MTPGRRPAPPAGIGQGVLPYFKKLETDSDFDGPLHGRDGPIRLQRYAPERWPGFTRGVMQAIEDEGWSNIADQNARFDDGFFPVAYSHTDTMRMGAAWRYLTAEVRRRPNLTVMGASRRGQARVRRQPLHGRPRARSWTASARSGRVRSSSRPARSIRRCC